MSSIPSSDILSAHVRGYAEAVRLHLADLGPEVVEDLTDGLEADLAEAVLDEPAAPGPAGTRAFDLTARFGPADEYAVELRAAAGLPAVAPEGRAAGGPVGEAWSAASRRWHAMWRPLAGTPGWAAVVGFVTSLEPAWWVLRGWVVAQAVLLVLTRSETTLWPETSLGRIVVVAAIVVSAQWGRGRWLPRWSWMPRVVAVASIVVGVIAIPMVARVAVVAPPAAGNFSAGYDAGWADGFGSAEVSQVSAGPGATSSGVWVDGVQVSNLFPYDAAGNPIADVQLYDDRGRPVRTVGSDATWDTWSVPDVPGEWSFQPAVASDGRTRWNVFPLDAVTAEQLGVADEGDYLAEVEGQEYPVPPTGVQPQAMPWPFLKAPTAIEDLGGGSGSQESGAPEGGAPEERGGDRPARDTAGERTDERPTSDGGAPLVEATQAD